MFNAIEYTQELEKAGFSRAQAEATVSMLHKFTDQGLATKQDISELRVSTKQELADLRVSTTQEIADLRVELTHRMEVLEYKLTVKMGTMLVVAVGVLAAIQKLI